MPIRSIALLIAFSTGVLLLTILAFPLRERLVPHFSLYKFSPAVPSNNHVLKALQLGQNGKGPSQLQRSEQKNEDSSTNSHEITQLHSHCVVYDRPPRTGSTSISQPLTACLRALNFAVPQTLPSIGRSGVLLSTLAQPTTRVAASRTHLYLTMGADHAAMSLSDRCARTLYVSGTAPMAERILSQIKYGIRGAVHTNSTVDASEVWSAVRRRGRAGRISQYEGFLSRYPFVSEKALGSLGLEENGGNGIAADMNLEEEMNTEAGSILREEVKTDDAGDRIVIEASNDDNDIALGGMQRLTPDYIIRKSHISEDLGALLATLGCSARVGRAQNVHTLVGERNSTFSKSNLSNSSSFTFDNNSELYPSVNTNGSSRREGGPDAKILREISRYLRSDDRLFDWLSHEADKRNEAGLLYARQFGRLASS